MKELNFTSRHMKLDAKLIQFLNTMRAKGGVINSHVVATADALIKNNHSPGSQHLQNFPTSCSLIPSVYTRMGYTRRMEQLLGLLFQRDCMMSAELLTFVI